MDAKRRPLFPPAPCSVTAGERWPDDEEEKLGMGENADEGTSGAESCSSAARAAPANLIGRPGFRFELPGVRAYDFDDRGCLRGLITTCN